MITEYKVRMTLNGEMITIQRDVRHVHSSSVHDALGTSSEAELQGYLDQCHVGDWYDASGKHIGPSGEGLEMFWLTVSGDPVLEQ